MKETLEKLWDEYLMEKCAFIDTEEERILTVQAAELHDRATALLDTEQELEVEKYVDALLTLEALYVKKAFLKGCEFALSFFLEASDMLR